MYKSDEVGSWTSGHWKSNHFPPCFYCSLRKRYNFTSQDTPFTFYLERSLPNAKQVTYGLCQLHCKPFVPFNKNKMNVCFSFQFCPTHLHDKWRHWWNNTLSSTFFHSKPTAVAPGRHWHQVRDHSYTVFTPFLRLQMWGSVLLGAF